MLACVIIGRLCYSNVFSCEICTSDVAMQSLESYWMNINSHHEFIGSN